MSSSAMLALMALCVLLQGFFSGSEIALVSADRLRLAGDAERGRKGAVLALQLLDRPAVALGTCLIGTNVSVIATATLGAALVVRHLEAPAPVAALMVIPFTLTLGELIPKAVYQYHADRLTPLVAVPLTLVATVLSPALWVIDKVAGTFGGNEHDRPPVTREELRLLLDASRVERLKPADQDLIKRVFDFTEASVEDAMVPLIRVQAVSEATSCAAAAAQMTRSGHSRLPIYRDRIDQITGIVIQHDLLTADDWSRPVKSVARAPLFVPETKSVDELLTEMRRARQRLAVAVDEYGGAVGIITVEDLLEEIVGEIIDESDRERQMVQRIGEKEWMASGRAESEHLVQACALELPEGDYETIAGFILEVLGRVPKAGEFVRFDRFLLTVAQASDRAILEVNIRRVD